MVDPPAQGGAAAAEAARSLQPVLVASQRAQGELLACFDLPLAQQLHTLELSPQVGVDRKGGGEKVTLPRLHERLLRCLLSCFYVCIFC